MNTMFKAPDTKEKFLKLAIFGAPGAGKTWSSLLLAKSMGAKNIAFIDTEDSAWLYKDDFEFSEVSIDLEEQKEAKLINFLVKAIDDAYENSFDFLIIDSATHAWDAIKDIHATLGGAYTDWNKANPYYKRLMNKILRTKMNVVCCFRAKFDDVITEKENASGKKSYTVQRMGLKAEARSNSDYEFTTVFSLDQNHRFKAVKDRTGVFADTIPVEAPARLFDASVGKDILKWLSTGMKKDTSKVATAYAETEEVPPEPKIQAPEKPVEEKVEKPKAIPKRKKSNTGTAPVTDDIKAEINQIVNMIPDCKEMDQVLGLEELIAGIRADYALKDETYDFVMNRIFEKRKELENF